MASSRGGSEINQHMRLTVARVTLMFQEFKELKYKNGFDEPFRMLYIYYRQVGIS